MVTFYSTTMNDEISITRAQLLKRLAICFFAISLILLVVYFVKQKTFMSIEPTGYEAVEVYVTDYEEVEYGIEDLLKPSNGHKTFVTVRYENKEYRYQINDSYESAYSVAVDNPFLTVNAYKYEDEIYPTVAAIRLAQNPGGANNIGFLIFFFIFAFIDVLLWAEYMKEVGSDRE